MDPVEEADSAAPGQVRFPAAVGLPVLGLVLCAALSACTGSGGPSSAPTSLDLTLRPIITCPAGAHIPPDFSVVVPDADKPPTSVLRVDDAVAFTAPSGSKVGAVGKVKASGTDVVCQSTAGSGAQRRAVILGRNPGFVQVAIMVPGSSTVKRTLVTVTY